MAGQQVTFSVNETGAACVATTDANGLATCATRPHPLRPGKDHVTVTYSGSAGLDYIDLASSATAVVTTPGRIRAGK